MPMLPPPQPARELVEEPWATVPPTTTVQPLAHPYARAKDATYSLPSATNVASKPKPSPVK